MKRFSSRLLFATIALLLPALLYLSAAEAHRARNNGPSSTAAKTAVADSGGETARAAALSPPTLVARSGGATGQALPERVVEARDADDDPDLPAKLFGSMDKETYLSLREEHINRLRGILPGEPFDASARANAIRELEGQEGGIAARFRAGATALSQTSALALRTWVPIGPAPIPNGQTTGVEVPVSGRTTAIAVHPTNPDVVYVGTAQGGLYRSLDGGATWTPLTDNALSLAIGAVTIDPTDPTIVYVGTGEANFSADSFFGVGLYIIRNADSGSPVLTGPFNSNGSTDVMSGRAISKILVLPSDHNTIFVSTTSGIGGIGATQAAVLPDRGLYRSTNAQSATPTFTKLTVQPANGGNRSITDMVFDPADATGNTLICSVLGFASSTITNDGGVWRTTNALDPVPAFTRTLALGSATATVRGAFSAVPTGGATSLIYLASGESNGRLRRSTDGGATWSATLPAANGLCGGQCFYDIVVVVDPNNPNIVYTGGASGSTIFKKSTDATATFVRMDTGLHADTHAITLAPSNSSIIYFGSDGGVWRSNDASVNWTSLNNTNFSATQFQSLALHPTDRYFTIGGTQDNGTPFLRPDNTWFRADFGDGGFSLIDQNAADNTTVTMYHTYFNQRLNLIGFARNLTVPCAVEGQWSFHGIYGGPVDPTVYCDGTHDTFNGIAITENVLFYAPMALGPGTPNTVYFGTDRLHRSTDRGDTMPSVSQFLGAFVSSIGISPQDDNVRIVGTDRSLVFATRTGSTTLTNVSSPSFPPAAALQGYVARAVIDPNNSNTAYVTFSAFGIPAGQHVWKTTNLAAAGGTTWAASGTGIPDVPVNAFVVDPRDSTVLYAGTDIGVYRSTDAGGSWSPFGTGLPRVAVFDMAIQQPNSILRIATHGKGMFEIATDTLTALSPAKVWVGLKNSDDVGLRLDLLAEVFVNATKVGQGGLNNVGSGSSGFNNALLNSIPLTLTGGPASAPAGAQLSIKVSARRTCFDGGHTSGTPRLWYNGQPVDSGASRDAGSRFDATISGTDNDHFLRNGSALSTTAGSSRTSVDVFVNSSAPCPARPFTSFGTWSETLP